MKVLLINDYGSLEGGAERGLLLLRDTLRQLGHDARVFASSAHSSGMQSAADYECRGSMVGWQRTLLQTCNPWALFKLNRILREFQPDIVLVKIFLTQLSPFILPALRKFPTVYHAVWLRAVCPLGTKLLPNGVLCQQPYGNACLQHRCILPQDWPLRMLQLALLRRWRGSLRQTAANSQSTRAYLDAAGFTPIHVIANGTTEPVTRAPLGKIPTITFAGRLIASKGVNTLIHAFARAAHQRPAVRLIIAGQGPELPALQSLVHQLQLENQVEFAGWLSPESMDTRFAGAWAQVIPTHNPEPFGMAAIEAMLRGTAVIASSSGGLAEIVRHEETGLLVPPADEDALTQALLRLLNNPELAAQMGAAGREVALREYSANLYVQNFLQLFHTLLENEKR